ncbi:MAG: hypothetical protein AAF316_09420 [Cyanobacteria bacterium P01_A01_bin.80]
MVRAVEQIDKEIAVLEEEIEAIAQELQNGYRSYLDTLGKALKHQLTLAVYHLCTRSYPQSFLDLSVSQREKLQKDIRNLAKKAIANFQGLLDSESGETSMTQGTETEVIRLELDAVKDLLENAKVVEHVEQEVHSEELQVKDGFDGGLEAELAAANQEIHINEEDIEEDEDEFNLEEFIPEDVPSEPRTKISASVSEVELDSLPPEIIASLLANSSAKKKMQPPPDPNTKNPSDLVKWQNYIEFGIRQIIKTVSRDSNRLMQKNEILPKKLPSSLLEAAAIASSEAPTEMIPGPPNLLNLAIEVETEKQPKHPEIPEKHTQITTINMRLGEVEFADMALSAARKKIRQILSRLNKVGQEYQKRQGERSTAEAESAWRAIWYED